jgi:hypothetical protein
MLLMTKRLFVLPVSILFSVASAEPAWMEQDERSGR